MCYPRVIVLKFGGSVLRTESDLSRAVHEIYHWRRSGWQVIAVVSAMYGRTDELLRECETRVGDPSPNTTSAHVANGEWEAASLLGLHLDRAGVPATVQHPAAIRLLAEGDTLDAHVVSVDCVVVRGALEEAGVVVLPGYVAIDENARTVALGRGGSDLTAIFLAKQLNADRCRLIKDVDGLYEHDPKLSGPPARRYDHATWNDALATDGSIVQHKAVRFAQSVNQPFELGRINDERPTSIDSSTTVLAARQSKRQLRVALLGLGTVGAGVWQHLQNLRQQYKVCAVACQHVNKRRAVPIPRSILTDDALRAATCGADIVIEVIGGINIARESIEAAIDCGAHIVTANKALLAAHGGQLQVAAQQRGVQLYCSAAVGGSMPVCEAIADRDDPVVAVRAVLNGTCNFLLERGAAGSSITQAIKTAQQRGYCERDPRRDLNGLDAADKLSLLAHLIGCNGVDSQDVSCEPLTGAHVQHSKRLAMQGKKLRQVATLTTQGNGIALRVALEEINRDDPLFDVPSIWNRAVLQHASGIIEVIEGRGAGRWPTAEAVIADLHSFRRRLGWPNRADDEAVSYDLRPLAGAMLTAEQ